MLEIRAKVTSNAKKDSITKIGDNVFEITVREPAQDNRANERVLQLVAATFGKSIKQVRIVSGHQSPSKRIAVL